MTKPHQKAQQAEATETPAEIEYGGETYAIPPAMDLPIEVIEAESELDVLKAILGEEQYARFRETKPTLRDLKNLGELVVESAGFDSLGN